MFSHTATLVYRISSPRFSPTACDLAACIVIVSCITNWVARFRMAMVLKTIPWDPSGRQAKQVDRIGQIVRSWHIFVRFVRSRGADMSERSAVKIHGLPVLHAMHTRASQAASQAASKASQPARQPASWAASQPARQAMPASEPGNKTISKPYIQFLF